MTAPVVTVVDFTISAGQEQELVEGFRRINDGRLPAGLLRAELLRGQDGAWRIQSTWTSREAVIALRASGESPAALALLDSLGVDHTHAVFTIEASNPAVG